MSEADKKKVGAILEKHDITKEQLIKRLQELAESAEEWDWDKKGESPESVHVNADKALLEYIGDKEVTKAFECIKKWYA